MRDNQSPLSIKINYARLKLTPDRASNGFAVLPRRFEVFMYKGRRNVNIHFLIINEDTGVHYWVHSNRTGKTVVAYSDRKQPGVYEDFKQPSIMKVIKAMLNEAYSIVWDK